MLVAARSVGQQLQMICLADQQARLTGNLWQLVLISCGWWISRLWSRQESKGFIHHSIRGSQYILIRYSECLAEKNIDASVGSVGDSYGNILAETINGLYKTEVIRHRGPWCNIEEVEFATLEWVDWFNNRRLLEPIGSIPSVEFEMAYYRQLEESANIT